MDDLIEAGSRLRSHRPEPTPDVAEIYRRRDRHRRRRRGALAGAGVAVLTAATVLIVSLVPVGHSQRVVTGPASGGLRAAPGGRFGVLPLMPVGEVKPLVLTDGTPVFEVRHSDGTVSVLGAAVSPTPAALDSPTLQLVPGLRAVADWLKPEHHFAAGGVLYNDHGMALGYVEPQVGGHPALPTTARDMTSYQVSIADGRVVVGAARPGAIRNFDPHRPASNGYAYNMDQVVTFDPPGHPLLPVLTISQALAEPAGTVSLVDADIIMVNGGPARICSAGHRIDHVPFPPCPASSPELPFVSNPSGHGYVSALVGPVFLRTGRSGFTEASVFGAGSVGAAYAITGQVPNPSP